MNPRAVRIDWEARLPLSERVRRSHESWLNAALFQSEENCPRIPARRVDEGGFSALMNTSAGRRWAKSWWDAAFAVLRLEW